MRPVVLLASCTQVFATGFSDDGPYEGSMALLQTTVLHQAARTFAVAGRHSHESSVDQTKQLIHLLDIDNDGQVSKGEVNTFATANGLNPTAIAEEFAGIDTNGNGILEQEEVTALLGSGPEPNLTPSSSPETSKSIPTSNGTRPEEHEHPKLPLLKPPLPTALAVTEVKPAPVESIEQPPQGDIEEYFTQVPMVSPEASGSAPIPEIKAAALSISKDTDSTSDMIFHQGHLHSDSPAISATQKIAEQLNSEVAAGAQAMTFQAAASTLRANASAILLHAQLEARAAAQKEATKVTMKNLKDINKLQSRASKAEMRAAALRARANFEMKEAYAAVAVASESMSQIGEQQVQTKPTPAAK